MLEFPSYNYSIFAGFFMLLGGIAGILGSVQSLKLAKRQSKLISINYPPTEVKPDEQLVGFGESFLGFGVGSIFTIAGVFIVLFSISEAREIARFRDIRISDIQALKITKLDTGGQFERNRKATDPESSSLEFTDLESIQSSFSGLKDCNPVWHNRDRLSDGYKLEMILNDGNSDGFFVTVYRENTNKSNGPLVLASRRDAASPYGQYQCTKLQEWVRKSIVPLFPGENVGK